MSSVPDPSRDDREDNDLTPFRALPLPRDGWHDELFDGVDAGRGDDEDVRARFAHVDLETTIRAAAPHLIDGREVTVTAYVAVVEALAVDDEGREFRTFVRVCLDGMTRGRVGELLCDGLSLDAAVTR